VHEALAAPVLRDQLLAVFAERATAPAVHIDGRWLSFEELADGVARTASAFVAAGLRAGERLGVLLPNGEPYVRCWLASVVLNVTLVPVNVSLVGAALRDIVLGARLHHFVVDPALVPQLGAACAPHRPAESLWAWPEIETLARSSAPEFPSPLSAPRHEDDALIIYTSGTTGLSKGVVLSRLAQLWHGRNYHRDFIQVAPDETGYTPLPLFHVSAQGFSLGCLLAGASVAIDQRFSAFAFWSAIRQHRARSFNYVSAMIPLLWRRPPQENDAENPVRIAVGSATSPEMHERFEERFGLRLIESYGQTETAGLWLTELAGGGRRIGTMGRPRRWLSATVRRDDGTECRPGETGELCLKPDVPHLMTTKYFDAPEATARAFRHGWYYTGDAAVVDEMGWFRFAGRIKEFIRRRGENISAFEIEREALAYPAVREAVAVGIPSSLGEDDVKLCVIPHEGVDLDPAALDAFLRPRLADFMRPRYIEIRSDFPRTPTQRVQKFRLREEGATSACWSRGGRERLVQRIGDAR
jgi:crotonobetaine/carnitine-CoA ligase